MMLTDPLCTVYQCNDIGFANSLVYFVMDQVPTVGTEENQTDLNP